MNKLKMFLNKNSSIILSGIGIIGFSVSTVLAVKSTPKALKIIEKLENPTKKDIVKATYKEYLPSLGVFLLSSACMVSSSLICHKNIMNLSQMYLVADRTTSELKKAFKEKIGETKYTEVKNLLSEKRIDNNPITEDTEILETGKGKYLFYDSQSGRYFRSDIENLRRIENDLNQKLLSEMFISLNELYYIIGIPNINLGEKIGWNVEDGLINFYFGSTITSENEPCIVLEYDVRYRTENW